MRPYFQIDLVEGTRTWYPVLGDKEVSGLLAISPIRRALAWEGRMAVPEVAVVLYDHDRALRDYIAGRTREIVGRPARIVSDYITFEGIVTAWELGRGRTFTVRLRDRLSYYLQKEVPLAKIDSSQYPNAPAESLGRPLLYPYGILDSGAFTAAQGAYGTYCVDATNNDYFVAAAAIEAVVRVWRNESGTWTVVPTTDYSVFTNAHGHVIVRVTPKAGGPGAGKEQIRLDVRGLKGDGTTAITNPAAVVRRFLEDIVGVPSNAFDNALWDAATDKAASRGLKMAGVVGAGGVQDAGGILSAMLETVMLEVFPTAAGLIGVTFYEPTADADVQLVYERDIANMEYTVDFQALTNRWSVAYAPMWGASGTYATLDRRDTVSIDLYGERQRSITLHWTYDGNTALETARKLQSRRKYPTLRATARTRPIAGVDLGKKVLIVHEDGLAHAMVYSIQELEIDALTGEMGFLLFNVEHLAPRNLVILGDKTLLPAFWTQASDAQRRYAYLCDRTTGRFSDGQPGKVL